MSDSICHDSDLRNAVSLLEAGARQGDMREAIDIINHDVEQRNKIDPGYSARFQRNLTEALVESGKLPGLLLEFSKENIGYFRVRAAWDRDKPLIPQNDLEQLAHRPEWDRGPRPVERTLYTALSDRFAEIDNRGWWEGTRPALSLDEIERWKQTQERAHPPTDPACP